MRKRSIPVLLLALVAWVLAWRMTEALMLTPFGYRADTFAIPGSTSLRLVGLFALLCSLSGVFLLALDFQRWVKGRER